MLKECNTTILLLQGSALFLQVFYFRRCCNSLHNSIKEIQKKLLYVLLGISYICSIVQCVER